MYTSGEREASQPQKDKCLLMHRNLLQYYLKSKNLNPFLANVPLSYPLKTLENIVFLVFPGCMKWKQWPKMN